MKSLPPPFTVTDMACEYLERALATAPDKTGVRIDVRTAGCSGLKYQFSLESAPQTGDRTVRLKDITYYVSAKAELHLLGATLDYVKSGMNYELDFIANPNEAARCGCGESFMPVQTLPKT